MVKRRKELSLEPDSIEYLNGLPSRTASKKVDEAIKLLILKEKNPKPEEKTPTKTTGKIIGVSIP